MVGAATGAGAGGLKIRGTLDTSMIERGFMRIKQAFASVKGFAKSFNSDLIRMRQETKKLVSWLRRMAIVGSVAIIGLASKAPAVAPALAKMRVEMQKLQRSLGEALAPAFERVAGWLGKLATWIGENKGTIGAIADAMLDWAEKIGGWLAPALERVSQWAADHPRFFAALLGGLILAPAALLGIKAVGGLISLFTGATVGASLLTALGYIALIGAAGYAGYKGAEYIVDKLRTYTGMGTDPDAPTDMSGQTLISRLQQKMWADITGRSAPWEDPLNPLSPAHQREIDRIKAEGRGTPGGMMSALREEDRRFFLLQWWDAIWG